MYEAHWGFSALPFLDDHDPRFHVETAASREALARLNYAVRDRRGAAVLGGPEGTGKTAVARRFAAGLAGAGIPVAVVIHPGLATWEFLREAARQLVPDAPAPTDPVDLLAALRDAAGKPSGAVLVVDNADRIAEPGVWESIRWLVEREPGPAGRVGVALVGPVDDLAWAGSFAPRIVLTSVLVPLDADGTARYVSGRVAAAGGPEGVFDAAALAALHAASRGICRRVNQLADLALFVAYGRGAKVVGEEIVREAASGWAGAAGGSA